MKKRSRPIVHRFEYWIFLLIRGTILLLPEGLQTRVGSLLGRLLFLLIPARGRLTVKNLKEALPGEVNKAEKTAHEVFRNLGVHLIDFLRAVSEDAESLRGRLRVEGLDNLRAAREAGKGVILLASHFGNWELMSLFHSAAGNPTHIVARPLDNPWLNRWVNKARERFGSRVINSKDPRALKSIITALKKGEMVGFLIDQNVRGDRGVFVDFFGRLTYTHKVVALVAQKVGSPVIPMFIRRDSDGIYCLNYRSALNLERTGNSGQDVITNTQMMTRVLEDEIRRNPAGWFWMHDRWKKRPKDAHPAVFLDRDGTLTKEIGYLHESDRLELIPGAGKAVRRLNESGLKVIVVTNQSGVARGYFPEDQVRRVNGRLVELLEKEGAAVDAVYYCPHHPVEGKTSYTRNCECRKPSPGMLVWAANEKDVSLEGSYVVGDKLTDVALARRSGARAVLVHTGYGLEEERKIAGEETRPDAVLADLEKAVAWILEDHEGKMMK